MSVAVQEYKPQPKQVLFHKAVADEVLYGGAAGGGKSKAILWDAVGKCLAIDNARVAIFRRTFPELEKSMITNFLVEIPRVCGNQPIYEYSKKEHRAQFLKTNAILEFNHCQYEDDMYRYQSSEYDFIYFDELTHFTEKIYEYVGLSRLRTTKAGVKPQIKSGSNPGNVGHEWVKRRFIDGADPVLDISDVDRLDHREKENELGYITKFTTQFIPAKLTDNKYLMEIDPQYVDRLKRLPEDKRKGLLEGSWDAFEGQFFKEWDVGVHVVQPFAIPREWKTFRAIDWGYAKPSAVLWFAIAPDKKVYVYRELYRDKLSVTELASEINKLSVYMDDQRTPERVSYTAGDPSMWSVNQYERGESIAYKLIEMGVPVVKGDNNRISGWAAVHDYLYHDQTTKPMLQIFSSCRELVRTLPQQTFDETRKEDLNTDGEDHLADALRYGLMSNPTVIKGKPVGTRKQGTFNYLLEQIKKQKHARLGVYVGGRGGEL